jgi:hypothetical protein
MGGDAGPAAVLARLEAGEEVPEGALVRCLRSPACPRALAERLAGCRWVRSLRRALPLLVRHPGCPQAFAMDALPRLGWHDLLLVVRDPRTHPVVRRQGEKRLLDRLKQLTDGERTALARHATRGIVAALLADDSPACVQALLDNAHFTEPDAVRLVAANRHGECVAAVVRHPRWGAARAVVDAALRSPALPFGVALGLLATLPRARLVALAASPELPAPLREPAARLLERRQEADRSGGQAAGSDSGTHGCDEA